jgi:predicted RecA/RadA family phage recombinase
MTQLVQAVQAGETLPYTNNTSAVITNKTPFPFGMYQMAIALNTIAIGSTASAAMEGVWKCPKHSGAIVQGAKVWWDSSANECINAPAINGYFIGYATEAAGSSDTTVNIALEEFCYEGRRVLTLAATGAQTLNAGDFASGDLVLFCPNTAAKTINLPALADIPIGAKLFVRKTDATAAAITLDPSGAETIAGGSTFATIDANNDYAQFINTGSNWALMHSVIA